MIIKKLPLRWRWAAFAGAVPIAVGMVTFQSVASPVLAAPHHLNKIQTRLIDGTGEMALGMLPRSSAPTHGFMAQDPGSGYFPGPDGNCSVKIGSNVKVNQSCLNIASPSLAGRGQAQNETAIAVNPANPNDLVAASNDYTYGDGLAGGTVFSTNGGRTWQDSQVPLEFTNGADMSGDTFAREYWQGGGDPSVAWDTSGDVYFAGLHFNRGLSASDIPDASSAVYVYRSTGNDGASWTMPGTAVTTNYDPNGTSGILVDKPYMTIDDWNNGFTDRIFVSWTLFAADGSAYIYGAYSTDYGRTFSAPTVVSRTSSLCTITFGAGTSNGTCNENQFSDPFFGPDGSLYVAYANYNNPLSSATDNHNQILVSKSTDGGASFSSPVQVAAFNDLPDCATYQGGQDFGRACVPEKGTQQDSVFRATNYPSGVVTANGTVAVTFGSYINADSNPGTGCVPAGTSTQTGANLYTGVKTSGACANKILLSVSTDGGSTFSGTGQDPTADTVVSQSPSQTHADQFWQWAAYSQSGALEVSYYDRQYGADETNGGMDVTLSSSGDLTHFTQQRATSSSMPVPTDFPDPQGNSLFFGDYSGLTASSAQANPLWTDTREVDLFDTGSNPPRVGTAIFPNGILANDETIFTVNLSTRIPHH